MSKRTRILAAVMATMVMTTAFIGCGSKDTTADKGEKKSLTVWSHLTAPEVDEIRKLTTKWGEDNNTEVKVVEDKGEMQLAITALQSSKGPDIMYGLAHDNLGTYEKAKVLEELPADYLKKEDYSSQGAVDAVSIGGKQYALPLSTESVVLFYNKKVVTEPAKSMEEVISSKKGFMYNASDFYINFGFLSANGGYVFKNNDGALDVKDIGLGNEGAQKGYQFIQDLVVKEQLFAADITEDIALAKFKEGNVGYFMSGPWKISDLKDMDFGIVPLPTVGGGQMKPFMGVQAAFVSAKSKEKDLSFKLMKYLEENSADIIIEKGNRIPASKKGQASEKLKANKYASVLIDAAKVAIPMPNVPAVQTMWTPGADNLKALIANTLTPKEAGDKITAQMKEKIATQ